MSKALHRIVSAAVLLPLLVFAVMGTSFASWRCRFDGVARSACCCPKAVPAETAAPADATVSGVQSCCQVEQHQLNKPPSDLGRANPGLAIPTFVTFPGTLLPAPQPEIESVRPAEPERTSCSGGWAIVVHKHAFLI